MKTKNFCILFLLITSLCKGLRIPQDVDEANAFFLKWEKTIEESKSKSNAERLAIYSHAIFAFGDRLNSKFENKDERWIKCYQLIQKEMMSIPGHAQYVVDRYETERKKHQDSERERFWMIKELTHLPSPETLKVLGDYLDDFQDTKNPHLPIEQQSIFNYKIPGDCTTPTDDLPWLSTYAIARIGLRNPPLMNNWLSDSSLSHYGTATSLWKETREWYQEVKAGKRTFSFLGQNVEYRFKPDGTWDTLPLAMTLEEAAVEKKQVLQERADGWQAAIKARMAAIPPTIEPKKENHLWKWLIGLIGIVIALSLLGKMSKKSKIV